MAILQVGAAPAAPPAISLRNSSDILPSARAARSTSTVLIGGGARPASALSPAAAGPIDIVVPPGTIASAMPPAGAIMISWEVTTALLNAMLRELGGVHEGVEGLFRDARHDGAQHVAAIDGDLGKDSVLQQDVQQPREILTFHQEIVILLVELAEILIGHQIEQCPGRIGDAGIGHRLHDRVHRCLVALGGDGVAGRRRSHAALHSAMGVRRCGGLRRGYCGLFGLRGTGRSQGAGGEDEADAFHDGSLGSRR
jgi:hypothetical protein